MKPQKLKKIAAITMARNDEFFLSRWIKYYGDEIGTENLYIYLDGTDQVTPKNAGAAHIKKLPHTDMPRATGDKYRIGLMNDLARELLKSYDIVIGCDCDEFLIVDTNTNKTLAEYLSGIKIRNTVSGLGLDVVKNAPVDWGSGFHSISGHNFHIDKNLYLLHFGAVDMQMLEQKAAARGADWLNHLRRRGNGTINAVTTLPARDEKWLRRARILQTFARPIYALDKPGMFGLKRVVKIPSRFKKLGI